MSFPPIRRSWTRYFISLIRKYLGDPSISYGVASKDPFIPPSSPCRILNINVTNPDLRGHSSQVRFHAVPWTRVTKWQGLVIWVSLVAQRLLKKRGVWGTGFEAPIMEGLWRIPRVPISRILHGLIACDLPKTEPWKPWELVNDSPCHGPRRGQPQPGDLCLACFPLLFPRYQKSSSTF